MGSISIVHWMVLLAITFPIYIAPSLVALGRKHEQLAMVVVINVLLGWTGLGWLIALIWAAVGKSKRAE